MNNNFSLNMHGSSRELVSLPTFVPLVKAINSRSEVPAHQGLSSRSPVVQDGAVQDGATCSPTSIGGSLPNTDIIGSHSTNGQSDSPVIEIPSAPT